MTCSTVKIGNTVAIVCTRGQRRRRCACGRLATKLCDFPRGRGTCSKPLCEACAVAVGPDRDHCPDHGAPAQGVLL